ncbi:MAG: hypothetical protein M3N45_14415 [Actinomycetota bacterium]|nr:hypothetical protein [Actinomycetota bacterium]
MKDSRVFAFTHDGLEHSHASAHAVWNAVRSNNEPMKNHAKYGELPKTLAKSGAARRLLWLISKHENGSMEVFTIHSGSGRETLPIFSHEEEAETFLWLGSPGAGWQARETTAGELVSLLYSPCADVEKVALDPLPLFGDEAMGGLVSLLREDFVRNLVDEREPWTSCQGSFGPEAPAGSESSETFGRRRA